MDYSVKLGLNLFDLVEEKLKSFTLHILKEIQSNPEKYENFIKIVQNPERNKTDWIESIHEFYKRKYKEHPGKCAIFSQCFSKLFDTFTGVLSNIHIF